MKDNSANVLPIDVLVAEMVNELDAGLRGDFEERAGIIEFDAGKARGHAECLALLDVLRRHPSVLTGVMVLEIELDGATHWLLTTDLAFARRYLSDVGGIEKDVLDLSDVIETQYGGVALLTTLG